ncbi:MAG: hypothetical protein MUC76_04135 [Spirochaetes bacterium]|jgi:hypothetical protein|nr:hypothetical protein [Spirochaetota bacterium]
MRSISGKLSKRLAVIVFIAAFGTQTFADEVNSTNGGLMLHGGIGTGRAIFGFVQNTDSNSDLGTGKSTGFDLGMLLNYHMFAAGLGFTRVSFDTLEWEEDSGGTTDKYKSRGSGYFWTLDATFGIKAFTEEGDMGFTHFFGGLRLWKALREQESVTANGVPAPLLKGKYELYGTGWIAGFRDFSTLPLGDFSLALQSGLWVYHAPMRELKINDTVIPTKDDQSIGFGGELGIGLAFEDMGLSIIGGVKMDITATSFKTDPALIEAVAGAGYAQFFLVLKKEVAL